MTAEQIKYLHSLKQTFSDDQILEIGLVIEKEGLMPVVRIIRDYVGFTLGIKETASIIYKIVIALNIEKHVEHAKRNLTI